MASIPSKLNVKEPDMNLDFYIPKNEILKKYIEGYYFMNSNNVNGEKRYWTFPNNYCIVTFSLDSKLEFLDTKICIVPSKEKDIYASCFCHYAAPVEVFYEKPSSEITIYFKPLGIHHFFASSDLVFSRNTLNEFGANLVDLKEEMDKIFYENSRESQVDALEGYLLSKFIHKDLTLMENILKDIELNLKIGEIAQKYNISRKHLNDIVLKYLGKSPIEYRKIFRFRCAIKSKKGLKNLTEITYENLFYDQSHLIKDFKSLTGVSPKTFFGKVNTDNKNLWLFI